MLAAFVPFLLLAILWVSALAPTASAQDLLPDCVTSERLEILNYAIADEMDARGLEPWYACDVGPWRTFGDAEWPLTDMHFDFVAAIQTAPEPRGIASPLAGFAALVLLALARNRHRTAGARKG